VIGQQRHHHRRIPANNVARIRDIIDIPLMVIPLLANQDLKPMLIASEKYSLRVGSAHFVTFKMYFYGKLLL